MPASAAGRALPATRHRPPGAPRASPATHPSCPAPAALCPPTRPRTPQVRIEHSGDHPGLRYLLENDAILVTLFDGCARTRVRLCLHACPRRPRPPLARCCAAAAARDRAAVRGARLLPTHVARLCPPLPAPTLRAPPRRAAPPPPPIHTHAAPPAPPRRSYDDAEIALQCGAMFRDCIRHEAVARLVLESHIFTDMCGGGRRRGRAAGGARKGRTGRGCEP